MDFEIKLNEISKFAVNIWNKVDFWQVAGIYF